MPRDDGGRTRRRFLAASAVGIATTFAGCTSALTGWDSSSEATEAAELGYGSTQEFTLEEGDGQDPEYGDLAKPVVFEASAGDEVTITQRSDAFDTYLVLEAPDGTVVAENDDIDYGDILDSRIIRTLDQSGEYTIWAGSLSGGATGPFTLSLERGLTGPGSEDEPDSDPEDTEEISFGETLNLTLEEGDGRDPVYDDLAKPVTFEASVGDEVTITQRSDAFDTYLVLEAPAGPVVAQNDDGEGVSGLNSRLTTTLGQDGEYIIWAGSLSGTATGQFTLTLEEGSGSDI